MSPSDIFLTSGAFCPGAVVQDAVAGARGGKIGNPQEVWRLWGWWAQVGVLVVLWSSVGVHCAKTPPPLNRIYRCNAHAWKHRDLHVWEVFTTSALFEAWSGHRGADSGSSPPGWGLAPQVPGSDATGPILSDFPCVGRAFDPGGTESQGRLIPAIVSVPWP